MNSILRALLDPSGLTPHGFCLLWEPGLIWLQAGSDALTGIAYYSIPLALIFFVRRRRDMAFGWIFWLFAAFILACGTTHFMSILTLWQPVYWLDGVIKLATALLSIATAIVLWPLIPRALALPSPETLREVNGELARQITERDLAEQALRASEARVRHMQKMETIGQLSGGIAHDFNNLLTVMMGGLDTIQHQLPRLRPGPEVARIEKSQSMAMKAVQRAAILTQRLLAFSRRQPLAPRLVDCNTLVTEMSELLSRALGATITLDTMTADGIWMAWADPNELENAILNLAVNARDAMPNGGKLTIKTGNTYLDEKDVSQIPESVPPGQYVMIAVSDTGTGMDAATLDRAFEPFFTTKDVGKGTGLGLSQVYGFMRQSSGYAKIQSEPGQGTTVSLYLPRRSADIRAFDTTARQPKMFEPGRGETILVVEDNDDLRAYSAGAIRDMGYVVLEAATGAEALAAFGDGRDIALLFTDIVLPGGLNGRELADEARRRRPELKVLYTTGYARDAIVHDGQLDPGVQLIGKPFTYTELAGKLRLVLDPR